MTPADEVDGSPELTARLIKESRELLEAIGDRLGDDDGSVVIDPDADEDPSDTAP